MATYVQHMLLKTYVEQTLQFYQCKLGCFQKYFVDHIITIVMMLQEKIMFKSFH